MINQELTNYIQQSLTAGVSKEEIITTLLNIGWQRIDVDEAFRQLEGAGSLYRFQPHVSASEIGVNIRKKGVALKILLLFLTISLLGGSAWAYYFFIQHPKLVFNQMPDRMAEVKTFKYDFNLNAKAVAVSDAAKKELGGESYDLTMKLNGNSKIDIITTPEGSLRLLLESMRQPDKSVTKFDLEVKTIKSSFYFKLNDLMLPDSKTGQNDFVKYAQSFKNQWIKIDPKETMDKFGFKQELLEEINKKQKESKEKQIKEAEEFYKKIKEKVSSYNRNLFKVESTKREILNNIKVYHYNFILDEVAAEWFAQAIFEVSADKNYDQMTKEEKDELDKIIENVRKIAPVINDMDFYIGQNDFYVYRIAINLSAENFEAEKDEIINFNGSVVLNLSDFNKPIIVEEPKKYKSIEEILQSVLGNIFGGMKNREMNIKGEMPLTSPQK